MPVETNTHLVLWRGREKAWNGNRRGTSASPIEILFSLGVGGAKYRREKVRAERFRSALSDLAGPSSSHAHHLLLRLLFPFFSKMRAFLFFPPVIYNLTV